LLIHVGFLEYLSFKQFKLIVKMTKIESGVTIFIYTLLECQESDGQNFLAVMVLSRAINFGRQCHFKIWLDCHKFKKFPCLIMPTSTKCQKIEKKMTKKCRTT
jgi:hypothetical protein